MFQTKNVIIYNENLNSSFDKNNYNSKEYFSQESYSGKINLLNQVKKGVGTLADYTGASNSVNIFAKSAEVTGSKGHNAVYTIGKSLGYKFKPWQAVNITKNVGNVVKFAGPAIAVLSAGMTIYGTYKEEQAAKKVNASKNQMNDSFYEIANDVVSQLNAKFQEYISNNIDSQIKEIDEQKIEILKKHESNSSFLNQFSELHGEYISFIETINK